MIERDTERLLEPPAEKEQNDRTPAPTEGPTGSSASAQLLVAVGRGVSILIISLLVGMAVWQGQQGDWPVMAATATFAALSAAELYLRRGSRP
ncbi:hypothetical protein AB0H60_31600 [Nocardia rhamnosiphila]|uniref:hypothetical protein n=1 Tax=Nocardia rhamnosiphila TaxID=426716 RepID=UPI0033C0A645